MVSLLYKRWSLGDEMMQKTFSARTNKINFFVITFAAIDKNCTVKNKYFLFAILVACFIALALMKPAQTDHAVQAAMLDNAVKTEVCCITESDNQAAILCEPTNINFSARIITVSCAQNKAFERLLKNKFSVTENFKIELSVENYIFIVKSLAYYLDNLTELRRLNI